MKLLDQALRNIERESRESDSGHFLSLTYLGELVTKLTTVGLLAAVADDKNNTRYGQLYKLVRATGVGEWAQAIDATLTGPPAQFLNSAAYKEQTELLERVRVGSWQYEAIECLHNALRIIGYEPEPLPERVQGKLWFHGFANLRNKSRGHGAISSTKLGSICEELSRSLALICSNFAIFERNWAFLYRNLSGKFRVDELSGDGQSFSHLRTNRDLDYENGIYIGFGDLLCRVELLHTNASVSDFFVANGGFDGKQYEALSYSTGEVISVDASPFLTAPGPLPDSETHGIRPLDVLGEALTNIPPPPQDYVDRPDLEEGLIQLLEDDRHPVVTLIGRGGIGKTALTLATIPKMASSGRFEVIAWFSARDIDLLPEGPKPVRPDVLTDKDIAVEYAKLMGAADRKTKQFDAKEYMSKALGKESEFCTLFIFDNFETITNLVDTYNWLDGRIRNPNKILITTRKRDFKGDFPLEIGGMTEDQCNLLIDRIARRYGIAGQITDSYRQDLFQESGGHPYVIKMLLGGIHPGKPARNVRRILAGQEDILPALFERTYKSLTPQAQRLFLTVANWNSTIPYVGLQCVILRDANEKIDVEAAVDELERTSLIETAVSKTDDQLFVHMPLAAQIFGKKQLNVSPYRAAVLADTELLRKFGAGSISGVKTGIAPHVNRFIAGLASDILDGVRQLDEVKPLLEFLARREISAWLDIAALYEEVQPTGWEDEATEALRQYLAAVDLDSASATESATPVWKKLAEIRRIANDPVGELNAWIGSARLPDQHAYEIANAANHFNSILAQMDAQIPKDEKKILAKELRDIMLPHRSVFSASDWSRLAWLCLHLGQNDDAMKYACAGLERDSGNIHCRRLVERLARQ